jgi:hypothetical protein
MCFMGHLYTRAVAQTSTPRAKDVNIARLTRLWLRPALRALTWLRQVSLRRNH